MICLFCNSLLDVNKSVILCPTCKPVDVTYIIGGSFEDPEIWYIHMRTTDVLIEFELDVDETRFYTGERYKEDKHLLTLNYLAEINPQNAEQFVQRILKLKAFT